MLDRDSLFLARLLNGSLSEDSRPWDLSQLSTTFQIVAARLLCARPEERQSVWDNFLAGCFQFEPSRHSVVAAPEPIAPAVASETPTPPSDPQPPPPEPENGVAGCQRRARLTCAAAIEPLSMEWLWYGRVPIGMLTMFAGDPKLGKSYVTLAMAAALSRGLPMPMGGLPNWEGSTILMSAEDDPNRTIVPRLNVAGADLAKVHILDSMILANGSEAFPSLRADIDAITAVAARLGDCRLIVIDPVSAYLKGVDDNRNAVVRGALTPLKKLAEQLGVAVVLVSHLTKVGSANGKHRVLGSIAYVGACRANHLFVSDPNDPTERRVLMLDNGGNMAARAPGLAYTIEERENRPRIEWSDQPVAITVEEALRPRRETAAGAVDSTEASECRRWLTGLLADAPKSAVDIFKSASEAGYTRKQVTFAKLRIGAIAQKQGFSGTSLWTWELPTQPFE